MYFRISHGSPFEGVGGKWNFVLSVPVQCIFTFNLLLNYFSSYPGLQSANDKSIYLIATEAWIFCGLAWLAMVFHMVVHFVKLVTNKIDAVTHHDSNLRIDITPQQVTMNF